MSKCNHIINEREEWYLPCCSVCGLNTQQIKIQELKQQLEKAEKVIKSAHNHIEELDNEWDINLQHAQQELKNYFKDKKEGK